MDIEYSNVRLQKVLAIVTFCGENEYSACLKSLDRQVGVEIGIRVIENEDNVTAHQMLRDIIHTNKDAFDFFMKVDADMILASASSVSRVVKRFNEQTDADHLVFPVMDWASSTCMMGMHVYTKNVVWHPRRDETNKNEQLFVDYDPSYPGKKVFCWDAVPCIATHGADSTSEQCFVFGFHRMLKVLQRETSFVANQARRQYLLLTNVAEQYSLRGDVRLLSILEGAEAAICSEASKVVSKSDLHHFASQHLIAVDFSSKERLRYLYDSWRFGGRRWCFRVLRLLVARVIMHRISLIKSSGRRVFLR